MINSYNPHPPFPPFPHPQLPPPPFPHHPLPPHPGMGYSAQPVEVHIKAPEIDVSTGGLAIALVVCGVMLALEKSRSRVR